jgi:hypothetical protein
MGNVCRKGERIYSLRVVAQTLKGIRSFVKGYDAGLAKR